MSFRNGYHHPVQKQFWLILTCILLGFLIQTGAQSHKANNNAIRCKDDSGRDVDW